ncbi:hypothetical protein KUTeg_008124 [Tegillarca granosa]|uniref:Glycosyltransferase family 92 protein n=1 Tax=Tegillarca granosa TaxID=220873 RepID=A0ABQ9F880_TEGGR|nr:hypothetical protein KUTeg_008124 [Tegillarca granosa]
MINRSGTRKSFLKIKKKVSIRLLKIASFEHNTFRSQESNYGASKGHNKKINRRNEIRLKSLTRAQKEYYHLKCKILRYCLKKCIAYISSVVEEGIDSCSSTKGVSVQISRNIKQHEKDFCCLHHLMTRRQFFFFLAEFIEFSRILCTEQFKFHNKTLEGDIKDVLDYYEILNIARTLPWSITFAILKIWYNGQSAAIWDCLYRNIPSRFSGF